jgi:signal transduction protein with GAF and PtsI domain
MMVDTNKVVLTAEHRQAIAETLVGRDVDLDRVYRALEEAATRYRIFSRDHEVAATHDTRIVMLARTYSRFISDHSDEISRRAMLDIDKGKVARLPVGERR